MRSWRLLVRSWYGTQQLRTNAMNESKSDSDVEDTALVLTTVLQAQTENEEI